jgi:hypothetical protein
MFESIELPQPDDIVELDDAGLVEVMAVATLVESTALEVRLAAMKELYIRRSRGPTRTEPRPPRAQAALPRASGRARNRRKRKRRR